jgi:hypothetical protein
MGKFRVNASGAVVGLNGEADPIDAPSGMTWPLAVDAYITIEPEGDDNPAPSFPGFIAGDMINRSATLTTNGVDGLDTNFASAAGSFVLATPSTSDAMDESEGVWFTSADGMSAALTLPPLPAGWIYEGWVSLSDPGIASLGRFATPVGEDSDLSGPLHGTGGRIDQDGYAFPGSDFPFEDRYSLDTAKTFITVEPASNADGPGPFILVVLDGAASPGGSGAPFPLTNSSSTLPSATVTIPQQ